MANDYFMHENPLTRHTLGRAEQVNSTFSAIEAAFDKLPTPDQINRGSVAYVPDLGTVNSFVVNFTRVPDSYTEGMNFTMKAANTNTGPSVINVNGLGAKQIRRYDGQPLEPGDIRAGQLVLMGYDGTRFLLVGAHGAEVAKARQWATSTSIVQSGEYGARGYAQQADRWANANEDVVVEGGRYSAKHWALKAMSNAGLLPDENLDIPARTYRDLGTAAQRFRDGNFSRNVNAAGARLSSSSAGVLRLERTGTDANAVMEFRLPGGSIFAGAMSANMWAIGNSVNLTPAQNRWFNVTSSGTTVWGSLTVSGTITGNGGGLTNIPATSLAGTISNARLGGDYSFANLSLSGGVTAGGQSTLSSTSATALTIARIGSAVNAVIEIRNTGGSVFAGNHDGSGFAVGGSANLNASSNRWLTVTSAGVALAGGLTVSGTITGNGSGLTNVPATSLTGTIAAARLPNHSANLLTSGTLPSARLSGSYSFASLTLSGDLTAGGIVQSSRTFAGSGDGLILAPRIGNSTGTDQQVEIRPRAGGTLSGRTIFHGDGTVELTGGPLVTSLGMHTGSSSGRLDLGGGDSTLEGARVRLHGQSHSVDPNRGFLIADGSSRLIWDANGVQADNGAGGMLPIATVSQASTNGVTTFPIGHAVLAGQDGSITRNESRTVRLNSSLNGPYETTGSGDVLAGTWRARGREDGTTIMQRVA